MPTQRKYRYSIAGGGTGGHLFPALAIADELREGGAGEISFFGTARGPEARIVPMRGYKLHKIWIKGYPRKLKPEVLLIPIKMLVSLLQCMFFIIKEWPDCIIATGGYVCLPFLLAGRLLGRPIIVHEQNSLPGVTTRIGARWAKAVFYSFAASEKFFSYHPYAVLSGNPVKMKSENLSKTEAIAKLGLNPAKKTLLVFGGSQGSITLNRAVAECAEELAEKYNFIWGTGKGRLPESIPAGVWAREFIDDMNTVYAASDLAICRSGAMTLAEIASKGLPAVLVPFPFAAEDHQRLNAEPMAEAGAAVLIPDREFSGKIMKETVDRLFSEEGRLVKMSAVMKSFYLPDAGKMIAAAAVRIAAKEELV